jgi:salicylate hydroxylase
VFTPPPPDIDIPSSWNAPPVPVATLEAALSAAEPRLRALAALAAPPSLIALSRHAPPAEWLHPTATATVLGDGAHPPCAYFEASAMALEDAAVLGALFGRLRRREQVSHLLHAYVGLRAPRTRARLADEARNTMIMTAPSAGPIAAARDGRMRALTAAGKDVLLSGATHDEVRGQWETFCAAWTYGTASGPLSGRKLITRRAEAEDAADDWWAKWGALEERAHDQVPEIVGKLGEVVIVVETEVVPL